MNVRQWLGIAAVSWAGVFCAQAGVLEDLLPRPQELVLGAGAFEFDPAQLDFALTAPSQEAVDRLTGHLREALGRLGVEGEPRITATAAEGFCLVLGKGQGGDGGRLDLPEAARAEGYELIAAKSGVLVRAEAERGLFYGMLTIEQLLNAARDAGRLPCLRIVDWPALAMRGYHEDYGRDQVPTIEDHKRSIRTVARFKMNTYLWFIEPDHFVYAFDPEISTEYDRFRFEEIRELVAYARTYYVEVIPVVELLGHMEMTLRHDRYAPLAEMEGGGGDLCATSDEAFALVRNMINEIAPAFGGRYFHCGLDESYAIGKGRSAEAVKEKGIEQVFAEYYTRMNDVVKSHGQTMMMYADIVLNHPGILDLLPKDIVMMFWDYSPRDHYPGLDTLKESGYPVAALSGLWDWNNLYPVYPPGFKNMQTLAAQAADAGAMGHFVSSWGDGHRGAAGINLSELNTYGFIYCGAVSWNPQPLALEEYSDAFALQFYGSRAPELAQALTRLARAQGDDLRRTRQARFMLHSDVAEAVSSMREADEATVAFWRTLKGEAEAVHAVLSNAAPTRNADYLCSVDLAARLLSLSADMALACRAVAEALDEAGFDSEPLAGAFEELATRHGTLWKEYERVYGTTNRTLNLNHIGRAWAWAGERLSALAGDLRTGAFPTKEPDAAP